MEDLVSYRQMGFVMNGYGNGVSVGEIKMEEYDDYPMPSSSQFRCSNNDIKDFDPLSTEREPPRCAVCGDRASGYHYSVVSCNGCKTFFRRTVITRRKFSCKHDGVRVFDKSQRCACRACRYQKCLEVGMNPKNIQFCFDKAKLRKSCDSRTDDDENNLPSLSPDVSLSLTLLETTATIKDLSLRESRLDALRLTTPDSAYYVSCDLEALLGTKSLFGDFTGILPRAVSKSISAEVYKDEPVKFWIITELALTIEYAKSFSVFCSLPKEDQWRLAASSLSILSIISLAYDTIDKHSETTVFPDGKDAYSFLLEETSTAACRRMFDAIFARLHRKPASILRSLRPSRIHIALLRAFYLFNPDVEGLTKQTVEIVAAERDRYVKALTRLVFNEEGNLNTAPSRLQELMMMLPTLYSVIKQCNDHVEICTLVGYRPHPLNMDAILGMRQTGREICLKELYTPKYEIESPIENPDEPT